MADFWPWGEPLYKTASYDMQQRSESARLAVKRLKSEHGCFLVEAWHAYLLHHGLTTRDPTRNTEEFCQAFLDLLYENKNDVRTALKVAKINVNWHKAGANLNQATNAGNKNSRWENW